MHALYMYTQLQLRASASQNKSEANKKHMHMLELMQEYAHRTVQFIDMYICYIWSGYDRAHRLQLNEGTTTIVLMGLERDGGHTSLSLGAELSDT